MTLPRPRTPQGEIEEAGGAFVRRRLESGARTWKAGDRLTAEEVANLPPANLQALIQTNVIELFPKPPPSDYVSSLCVALWLGQGQHDDAPPPPVTEGDFFLMSDQTGKKFHIIQGRQVTDEPLTRAKAQAKMKELSP